MTLGAESGTPNPAGLVDRAKERAGCNPGGRHPSVNSSLHPIRYRNGSYVAALSDKIGYDPGAFELSRWRDGRCGGGLRVVVSPV
jgi:hypothetical protein